MNFTNQKFKNAKFLILDKLSKEQAMLFIEELEKEQKREWQELSEKDDDFANNKKKQKRFFAKYNEQKEYLYGKYPIDVLFKEYIMLLDEHKKMIAENSILEEKKELIVLIESCVFHNGLLLKAFSDMMECLELYFVNHAVRIDIYESEDDELAKQIEHFYLKIPQQDIFYEMLNNRIKNEYEEIKDLLEATKERMAEFDDFNPSNKELEVYDISIKLYDDIEEYVKEITDELNAIDGDGFLKVKQELFEFHKQEMKRTFDVDLRFDEWNRNQPKFDMESFEVVYPADYFDELADYLEKIKIS